MSATPSVRTGRQYRWLTIGLVVAGVLGLFAAQAVDQRLLGLIVYAAGAGTALALSLYAKFVSDAVYCDERQRRLEARASNLTINLLAYIGGAGFISLFLLDEIGYLAMGARAETLLNGFVVVLAVWALSYAYYRFLA